VANKAPCCKKIKVSLRFISSAIYKRRGPMKEMRRREFVKAMAVGGAVLGLGGIMSHRPQEASAGGKYDIGQCKRFRPRPILPSKRYWAETGFTVSMAVFT